MVTPAANRAPARPTAWWAGVVGRGVAAAWAAVWLGFIGLLVFVGDDPLTRPEWVRVAVGAAFAMAVGVVPWINRWVAICFLAAAGVAAPVVIPALMCGWGNWPWAAVAWAAAVFTLPFWWAASLMVWSHRSRGGGAPDAQNL